MAAGLHWMGVNGLLAAYRAGRVSVTAAVDHHLARIERFNPALRAFTHIDATGARAAAAESAARWDAGTARPLEGVPLAVKANLEVAGLPQHAGLGYRRGRIAASDALVVARLRAAGGIILGVTAMDEAALGALGDNPHYGRVANPWGEGLTPGGSSGGSAVAVAAGLCAAAIGTDTLGSIRIPASYCGVAGLKPTFGLVPSGGLVPMVPVWDTIGPIARSVGDIAAVLATLAPAANAGAPIADVATLALADRIDLAPAVHSALRLAEQLLKGLGIRTTAHADRIDPVALRFAAFVTAVRSVADVLEPETGGRPEALSDRLTATLAFGRRADAAALAAQAGVIAAAADEIEAALLAVDALLLPTAPQAAFPHDSPPPVTQGDFTLLANLAGLPALTIPAGWTTDGLPVGVQLVGRKGEEGRLLALGERLEAALNSWTPPPAFR